MTIIIIIIIVVFPLILSLMALIKTSTLKILINLFKCSHRDFPFLFFFLFLFYTFRIIVIFWKGLRSRYCLNLFRLLVSLNRLTCH